MSEQENLYKQLNRSGFPFQLRVEEEIRRTFDSHRWSVASREHPWINPEFSTKGFVDIILKHSQFNTFRLVIECKRMKSNDARQLQWLFLIPDESLEDTSVASCLEVIGHDQSGEWKDCRIWEDVLVTPESLESEICILPNDEQKKQPILESLAAEVLESLEGIAEEEVRIVKSQGKNGDSRLFIFPAVVTNAEINVCHLRTGDIKITDGTIDTSMIRIKKVPFVRFRKSLKHNFPDGRISNLRDAQKARERTVFIVNANAISEFLSNWRVEPKGLGGFAISHFTKRLM